MAGHLPGASQLARCSAGPVPPSLGLSSGHLLRLPLLRAVRSWRILTRKHRGRASAKDQPLCRPSGGCHDPTAGRDHVPLGVEEEAG